MVSPFFTFEFRRWLAAGLMTFLVVSLQVAQAARATDGGAVVSDYDPDSAAPGRAAVAILPVPIEGTVVASGDGVLGVHETDAPAPVAFGLDREALLVRDGAAATAGDLRTGDRVRMTIDGQTGRILQLRADPAAAGWQDRLGTIGPLAAIALVIVLGLLAGRRWAPVRSGPHLRRVGAPRVPVRTPLSRFGQGGSVTLRHRGRALGA